MTPLTSTYRLVGQRGPLDSTAWIDPARHPDPRAALEAVLGPLSKFTISGPLVTGTMAESVGEFMSAGTGVVNIPVRAIADALLAAFDGYAWGDVGAGGMVDSLIGGFVVVGDDNVPSGKLESTRTVTIDGVKVWITADGRRWFKEPVSEPLNAVPAVIRVSGAPELDAPGQWLRRGGDAPWSGFTIGGRPVESVGVGLAAAA
ncbi:MAG: hypothetical protein WCJ64_23220 [Rhodospirillaceae bacterium]